MRTLLPEALAALLATTLAASAMAQGGKLRGPVDPTPQPLTGVCGLAAQDMVQRGRPLESVDGTTWDVWWSFRRERYLAESRANRAVQPAGVVDDDARVRIATALTKLLRTDQHPEVVAAGCIALARLDMATIAALARDETSVMDTTEFLARMATCIGDPRQEVAESAVLALGIVGGERSTTLLSGLANQTGLGCTLARDEPVPDRIRALAAYGLGVAGSRTIDPQLRRNIVRSLCELLATPSACARDIQCAALCALGLVPLSFEDCADEQFSTCDTRLDQIVFVERLFADQSFHYIVRSQAPTTLAQLLDGAPDASRVAAAELLLPTLGPEARQKDELVMSCILALGEIGDCSDEPIDQRIRSALIELIGYSDHQSKNFTNVALARIGGRTRPGSDAKKGRDDVREHLLAQLTRGKSHMRPWAALGIGILERQAAASISTRDEMSAAALAAVRAALEEAHRPDQVGAYAIALAIAGDPRARADLRRELDETHERIARGFVAQALGMLGDDSVLVAVPDLVQDRQYAHQFLVSAALGLGVLGDGAAVPDLCALLPWSAGHRSAAAVAESIALLGDARAIDPLIELTHRNNATDGVRALAVSALGILADRSPASWNEGLAAFVNYRATTSFSALTDVDGTGFLDRL